MTTMVQQTIPTPIQDVAIRAVASDPVAGGEATWYAVAVANPALSLGVVRFTMWYGGGGEMACDCGTTAPGQPCAHLRALEAHLFGSAHARPGLIGMGA